jgi:hypothetical protein
MAGNAILNVFNDHLELLGFTDDEALDSLNDQGITSYSALLDTYNRKDGFDNFWKRLASPGGTMADRNHNGRGAAPQIPVRGVAITLRQQTTLIQLAYWVRHRNRIQRHISPDLADALAMRKMGEMMNQERELREAAKASTMSPIYNNRDNIRRVTDSIEGYLSQQIGSIGAPLTYVIRQDEAVDNTIQYDDEELFEELVARSRHTSVPFQTDNARVWIVIRHVFFGTEGQAWVEEYQSRQNGRAAWEALQQRYLGDRAREFNAEEAETELRT